MDVFERRLSEEVWEDETDEADEEKRLKRIKQNFTKVLDALKDESS